MVAIIKTIMDTYAKESKEILKGHLPAFKQIVGSRMRSYCRGSYFFDHNDKKVRYVENIRCGRRGYYDYNNANPITNHLDPMKEYYKQYGFTDTTRKHRCIDYYFILESPDYPNYVVVGYGFPCTDSLEIAHYVFYSELDKMKAFKQQFSGAAYLNACLAIASGISDETPV